MSSLGELIYSREKASKEAISKAESHTPRIDAPDRVKADQVFDIAIRVGPHPNTIEHSIRWIDVYFSEEGSMFNPIHITRVLLEPVYIEPIVRLSMKLRKSGTLYVIAYCNLHGLWGNKKRITVE